MGSDWEELTLGEFVTLQRGHDLPTQKRVSGSIPILGSFGITGWHNESKVNGPGVTVGRSGASYGVVTFSGVDFWPLNTALFVKDFHGNDPLFASYLLKSMDFKSYNSGSAVQSLNRNHIHPIKIKSPSLPEQKAIANILGSLDDKIELNRQMNETLESMAQVLFKSWFVDFDPVIDNALAAGNPIPDVFAERAQRREIEIMASAKKASKAGVLFKGSENNHQSLFPSEFEFTEEMGWIPKGWAVKSFGDLLDQTIGGDWGKEKADEKHTVKSVIIRGTDIPVLKRGSQSLAPERWVEVKKLATRKLYRGDIVIEVSGGSPTQSTGRSIYLTENILNRLGENVEPASFCRKFSPKNKLVGLYAGIHLEKIYVDGKMWEYQNQSTGISNFQTKSFLEREYVVIPGDNSVLELFYEGTYPLVNKKTSNEQIHLAKLRDTLLPKLLSGELRIPDVEALIDEATA